MGRRWPLTGRAEELEFVDAALRRADGPRGLVLAGAAGVGKTRLAREALAAAARRGAVTRWATATASAQALPLGAFAPLVGEVGGDLLQVLPQASAALTAGGGKAGVVLGVDDGHLLDGLSAMLLHQIVLRRAATVVVTVRSGEPAPDAVTALWKDGHLERLEVQPLSEPETAALLEAVLGGQVASSSAAELWRLTRGNALFLRQLVDDALDAGGLRAVEGVWRLTADPAVSPVLADLVTARMGALPEPVRDVVDVLALAEPLRVELLGGLTDPQSVERCESRGLMQVEQHGEQLRARLAHPLYGETRRAAMGRLRARRLRGEIVAALAAEPGADPLRRAVLALDSDVEPDAGTLTEAAAAAVRLFDLPLAVRLARAAVDAGGGFTARVILANSLSWLSQGEAAEAELQAAAPLAADDLERTQAAFARAANLFFTLRRPDEAESVLDEATGRIGHPDARAALVGLRAAVQTLGGRSVEALPAANEALQAALPDVALVLATFGVVGGLGVQGHADDIGPATERAYAAGARAFDAAIPCYGLAYLHVVALRLAGYLDELDRLVADRRRAGSGIPGPPQLYAISLLGHAELARGRLTAAVRWFREALSGLAPADTSGFATHCLLGLASAHALAGDVPAARQALTELAATPHPAMTLNEPEQVLARAWVAAAEGAVSEATALCHDAARLAADRGQHAHEVLALQAAVCLGDSTGAGRLAELATQVDGPRAPAAAAHAAALVADDPERLATASEGWELLGDLLAAADAAAQAAVAFRARDRRSQATQAAARADRLAGECGARTPALRLAAQPLPLTQREREIVTLAADGLSNREIADRLVVSVRTIEGHLYRAGAKLGTTTRAELADVLGRGRVE